MPLPKKYDNTKAELNPSDTLASDDNAEVNPFHTVGGPKKLLARWRQIDDIHAAEDKPGSINKPPNLDSLAKGDRDDVKDGVVVHSESNPCSQLSGMKNVIGIVNVIYKEDVETNGQNESKIENQGKDKELVIKDNSKETPYFACDLCSQVFMGKTGFVTHLQHHKNWCDTCNRGFLSQEDLDSHKLKHTLQACQKCPRKFTSKNALNNHQSEHTGAYKFTCPLCFKGFNRKRHFEGHMNGHNGVYPFTCEICQQKFAGLDCLANHKRRMKTNPSHGSRQKGDQKKVQKVQFKCAVCQNTFDNRASLDVHKKKHHEKRQLPFVCIDCDVGYMDRSGLVRHGQKKHGHVKQPTKPKANSDLMIEGRSKYMCRHCPKVYSKKGSLYCHYRDHHAYSCAKCQRKFTDKEKYQEHLKLHKTSRYVCPTCPKVFPRKSNRNRHISMAHSAMKAHSTPSYSFPANNIKPKVEPDDHVEMHEPKHLEFNGVASRCPYCQLLCGRKLALKVHLTDKHPVEVANKLADKVFKKPSPKRNKSDMPPEKRKAGLVKGVHKGHDQAIEIPQDDKNQNLKAKRHVTVRDVECVLCEKRFRSERIYAEHMKSHRLRDSKCSK